MKQTQQKTETKGRGRPKWLPTKDELAKIENLASRGLTQDQIAASLGISYQTLNERKKEFPDFSEIIKRGGDRADGSIVNALFENASNGNVTAQIFWVKSRLGWKETEVKELTFRKHEDILAELE